MQKFAPGFLELMKVLTNGKLTNVLAVVRFEKLSNELLFALIRQTSLCESVNYNFVRHFDARKLYLRPLLRRNLSQNKSFSIDFGYDCRSVLKHVLKPYDIFLTYTTVVSEL